MYAESPVSICPVFILVGIFLSLVGCGGSESSATISALSASGASTVTAGGGDFTLSVTGTGFRPDSVVQWNGNGRPTTYVSKSQLTAAISGADIANPSVVQITVQNGSRTSAPSQLNVNAPAPAIASISPTNANAGAATFTLTVNGNGFISSSTIKWNGSNRTTTFVSSTRLTASITAADLASPGTASVTVTNPTPGGGTSTATTFTIDAINPVPTISSLSPANAEAGSAGFTLTVNGTNFVSASKVQWNGSERTTTFVSATQLTAPISANDLVSAGTADVAVVSPAPGGGSSATATFTVNAAPTQNVGVIRRISVATDGTQGNGDAGMGAETITANGRYVVFSSSANTMTTLDTYDVAQIYVRDTCIGANGGCAQSTSLVTVGPDGNGAKYSTSASSAVVTPDGRYIAFASGAYDLVANDNNGAPDVFVRDTCAGVAAGCTPSTSLVSVTSTGDQVLLEGSLPAISANGRYIVFRSMSTPYPNDTYNFYVRDTCAGISSGCTASTSYVGHANHNGSGPAISADGRYVAFDNFSTVSLFDTCNGAAAGCSPSTIPVSVDNNGAAPIGVNSGAVLSADGRYVAWYNAHTGVPDFKGTIFLRDTCLGATGSCSPSTIVISDAIDGSIADKQGAQNLPSMTPDARFVAFQSNSSNLVSGDTNNVDDLFVRDTCIGTSTGCTPSMVRVTLSSTGAQLSVGNLLLSGRYVITADGKYVVFDTTDELVPEDTNLRRDVFIAKTGF